MSCERCGAPAQGRLCADCEQMDRVETAHEHRSDGGSVAVAQTDTENHEVPPRPEEVIDDSRYQYQAMTQLDDDEYAKLAADIRKNGVLQPVIVDDSPEQVIIDGHHREAVAQHYDLPKSKQPAYVVVGALDEDEKLSRAIKQNLIGRDTTEGVKSHAVKQYIELSWDRTDDGDLIRPETDTEVAEKLGVDQSLVSRVVNNMNAHIIYSDRVAVREYYEQNPDASYSEVSEQVDTSRPTVTGWIKEDFDEGDGEADEDDEDDQPTLTATTTDATEAEEAAEVFRRVNDDSDSDADDVTARDTERQPESEADTSAEPEDPEPPSGEYDVIYADPPWRYDFSKTSNRRVENKYQTMTLSEIKNLDVPSGDDGVLYLWATAPKLTEAIEVLQEWGFEYTTNLVWDKEQMGMGYWSRVQHEHLLIGTRGDVSPPEPEVRRRSVVRKQREEHSAKPDAVADMIANQHPQGELIELFARDTRSGWDVWGNEVVPEVADD